jgi:hypothetical protein
LWYLTQEIGDSWLSLKVSVIGSIQTNIDTQRNKQHIIGFEAVPDGKRNWGYGDFDQTPP